MPRGRGVTSCLQGQRSGEDILQEDTGSPHVRKVKDQARIYFKGEGGSPHVCKVKDQVRIYFKV